MKHGGAQFQVLYFTLAACHHSTHESHRHQRAVAAHRGVRHRSVSTAADYHRAIISLLLAPCMAIGTTAGWSLGALTARVEIDCKQEDAEKGYNFMRWVLESLNGCL